CRRGSPVPSLAPARLRPGAAPRRRALPLRARHVRSGDPRGGRPPSGRLLLAAAGRAGHRPLRPSRRRAGRCRMTLLPLELEHPQDARLAQAAAGPLRTFNQAGILDAADVHVARRLCALAGDQDELVALAVAFVVRAVRGGSVCVDLATVADADLDVTWP